MASKLNQYNYTKKFFFFQGVLNGMYTSGGAAAVAANKEQAILRILERYDKDRQMEKEFKGFWDKMYQAHGLYYFSSPEDFLKKTGKSKEEIQKQSPHGAFCDTGTWNGTSDILPDHQQWKSRRDAFEYDLQHTEPIIMEVDSAALYWGGGD